MKTRISGSFLGLGALSLLAAPHFVGVACAQETLAGLGAASSIGAGLGAAAAGSAIKRPNMPRGAGEANALIDEAGNAGNGMNNLFGDSAAPNAANAPAPIAESYGIDAKKIVSQLRKAPTALVVTGGMPRQTETKEARQRRLARLSPAARKKAIQEQYKIPPVGWLGRYLPQDRYKFSKNWKYVSTEDTKYYYTPQGLALHKFNPNRVIGFRTWQDAMLAGYKPDPYSKPEPAPDLIRLVKSLTTKAAKTADAEEIPKLDSFYKFVEYLYAGQMNEGSAIDTLRYAQSVHSTLNAYTPTRWQARARAITALQVAMKESKKEDLILAGSRAFEQRVAEKKAAITNEVNSHNTKVSIRAEEITQQLVFPTPLSEEILQLKADLGGFSSVDQLPEVRIARRIGLEKAQEELGGFRDADSEIGDHLRSLQRKAVNGSGGVAIFPTFTKVSAPGFSIKVGRSQPANTGPNFSPRKEPWVRNGYWKFVGTDVAKIAYKPSDPRVRSFPANRIIGFATARDVIEAGYSFAEGGGISLGSEARTARAELAKRKAAAEAAATKAQAGAQPAAGQPAAGQPAPAPAQPAAGQPAAPTP